MDDAQSHASVRVPCRFRLLGDMSCPSFLPAEEESHAFESAAAAAAAENELACTVAVLLRWVVNCTRELCALACDVGCPAGAAETAVHVVECHMVAVFHAVPCEPEACRLVLAVSSIETVWLHIFYPDACIACMAEPHHKRFSIE